MELKPTGNECDTCGATLISNRQLKKATPEQRAEVKARGWRRANRSNRCHTCCKRLRAGTSSNVVPREIVVDEWRFLHESGQLNRGEPKAQRIRQAAPRIGMTTTALEKALERAGVAA